MRIVHVINSFSHTSIPIEMANLMARETMVDVISLYDTQEQAEGFAQISAEHCHAIFGCGMKKNKMVAVKRLKALLRNGHYDIIQTHHSMSVLLSSFFMYGTSTKVVTTVHGNRKSYSWKQNWMASYYFHNVDGIVYNSQTTKDSLYSYQKSLIRSTTSQQVIYNGVDCQRIQECSTDFGQNFCAQFGLPQDAYIIAQIGRLEPVKNAYTTITAFEKYLSMPGALDSIYLVIVGDGKERNKLEEYVFQSEILSKNRRVVFTGMLKREDVYSLMHRINLQIISSYFEGFCNALFENLSLGHQIVVSDIPIFKELLGGFSQIYRFNPHDVDDAADCLSRSVKSLISDEQKQEYIKYTQSFDTSICVHNYLRFYHSLIG